MMGEQKHQYPLSRHSHDNNAKGMTTYQIMNYKLMYLELRIIAVMSEPHPFYGMFFDRGFSTKVSKPGSPVFEEFHELTTEFNALLSWVNPLQTMSMAYN